MLSGLTKAHFSMICITVKAFSHFQIKTGISYYFDVNFSSMRIWSDTSLAFNRYEGNFINDEMDGLGKYRCGQCGGLIKGKYFDD
jgi:hypothetical protein